MKPNPPGVQGSITLVTLLRPLTRTKSHTSLNGRGAWSRDQLKAETLQTQRGTGMVTTFMDRWKVATAASGPARQGAPEAARFSEFFFAVRCAGGAFPLMTVFWRCQPTPRNCATAPPSQAGGRAFSTGGHSLLAKGTVFRREMVLSATLRWKYLGRIRPLQAGVVVPP